MVRLSEIFSSKAQAALIEYLVTNKERFYNQVTLASSLNLSSSTISRLIENLAKLGIVRYDRFDGGIKVISLNPESELTQIIINFLLNIKELSNSIN